MFHHNLHLDGTLKCSLESRALGERTQFKMHCSDILHPATQQKDLCKLLLTRPCWSVAKWGSEWRSGRVVGGLEMAASLPSSHSPSANMPESRSAGVRQREQSDLDIVAERKRRSSLLFCKISGLLLFLRTRLKKKTPEKTPHKTKTFN